MSDGRRHLPRRVLLLIVLVTTIMLGTVAADALTGGAVALAQTASQTTSTDGGDSQNVLGGIGGDPLSRNGLVSPFCRSGTPLTATQAANCKASGSPASAVPIGNYSFDIHINTSMLGLGAADAMLVIQNVIIQPLWLLLLWLTHGICVVLGWCFQLDLFDRRTMGSVATGLTDAERLFTRPWLKLTLVLGAAPLLYHGVLRRNLGKGLTQLLLTLLVLTFGFWIISNPLGSVGKLAGGVQTTSLATVSAFSSGRVNNPEIDFNRALQNVFRSAIKKPYAYMEFGDVDWGVNPRRRDRRLFAEKSIQNAVAANLGSTFSDLCSGSVLDCANSLSDPNFVAQIKAAMQPQIQQARSAASNADLFLAFPANGSARNSINDDKSLYRTLCQPKGGDKDCTGPTRHEANFRKQGQTLNRLVGLAIIAFGLVGLVVLMGYIAISLLKAALFSLFYLMCTPVAVVFAPLGDVGLRHVRTWGIRLFGSLIAKLIYSVLLGIVFLVVNVLAGMGTLGFWTQWFLIGSFYWLAWVHRDELLAFLRIGHEEMGRRGASALGELYAARMAARALGTNARRGARAVRAAGGGARRGLTAAGEAVRRRGAERTLQAGEHARASYAVASEAAHADRESQTDQVLRSELDEHRERAQPITRLRKLTEQLQQKRSEAMEAGDYRKAEALDGRLTNVSQRLNARRKARPLQAQSDDIIQKADQLRARTGSPLAARDREDRSNWLDQQAETPARAGSAAEIANGTARDYRRLAALADPTITPRQFADLKPAQQEAVRRQVDDQLAKRQAALSLVQAGKAPTRDVVDGYVAAHRRAGGGATPVGEGRVRQQLARERIRRQFGAIDREMQDRWRDRHVIRRRRTERKATTPR